MMDKNKTMELRILKTILGAYIILAIVIAGLNYGYASQATPSVAAFISRVWHFYENWIKTLFIIIGSLLTLRIIGTSQRSTMRKRNLIGFIVSALVVHIAAPISFITKKYTFLPCLCHGQPRLYSFYIRILLSISADIQYGVLQVYQLLLYFISVSVLLS